RKDDAVDKEPFSTAYGILRKRLRKADRWMIVGYCFGDKPLNRVLKNIAAAKKQQHENLRILVLGKDPEISKSIAVDWGLDGGRVYINNDGIPESIGCCEWRRWAT